MSLKKPLVNILLILSACTLMGAASCQKADYFECIIIGVDNEAKPLPMDKWYLFCVNQKTAEEKSIWLKDAYDKCIRHPAKHCKLLVTDTDEKEIIRKYYKDQCAK